MIQQSAFWAGSKRLKSIKKMGASITPIQPPFF
jgi:hypothetical protein